MTKDLLSIRDLTASEIDGLFDLAADLKAQQRKGVAHPLLTGKTLGMIFEKPSLRTRVTFEVGMAQLGGRAIYLAPTDIQLGKRETVKDVAKNLERWVDGIMARTFTHQTVEQLARHAAVPVINGLSDLTHPCQILADLFTLREKRGPLRGVKVHASAPARHLGIAIGLFPGNPRRRPRGLPHHRPGTVIRSRAG